MPYILKILPQMKESICCVIGEVKAVNHCTMCILQPTVHGATQLSFHLLLVQDIAAERGHFQNQDSRSIRKDRETENCAANAGCVCACYQSGPRKSTLRYGFM